MPRIHVVGPDFASRPVWLIGRVEQDAPLEDLEWHPGSTQLASWVDGHYNLAVALNIARELDQQWEAGV